MDNVKNSKDSQRGEWILAILFSGLIERKGIIKDRTHIKIT